ncbi:DUF397 domain-containing protein [Streptomyces sp. WMMC1477]|uniref:DUF397 domain-containing protein n=1 Tax=Streptomyces sp. WMMC1477 TaxID=3015155 RepID=UPI0022B6D871|nr:DUF397 domain-containing protein [Streptomyces sp. WMMC1477]MCZ7432798.1 DUF397 domain-containing protein [Streptomyces sp. WMMC1477]
MRRDATTTVGWQKSSFCGEGSACVELRLESDGFVHLGESDAPAVTVATPPGRLGVLLAAVKAGRLDQAAR